MTALLIGGGAGLAIVFFVMVKNALPPKPLRRARSQFESIVRHYAPSSRVSISGGNFTPPVVWIKTATDAERSILQMESSLLPRFEDILLGVGYPAIDIRLLQFVVESQETVNKDFGGKWGRRKYVWYRERF